MRSALRTTLPLLPACKPRCPWPERGRQGRGNSEGFSGNGQHGIFENEQIQVAVVERPPGHATRRARSRGRSRLAYPTDHLVEQLLRNRWVFTCLAHDYRHRPGRSFRAKGVCYFTIPRTSNLLPVNGSSSRRYGCLSFPRHDRQDMQTDTHGSSVGIWSAKPSSHCCPQWSTLIPIQAQPQCASQDTHIIAGLVEVVRVKRSHRRQ